MCNEEEKTHVHRAAVFLERGAMKTYGVHQLLESNGRNPPSCVGNHEEEDKL